VRALLEGVLAGLGIAVPIGPIGVLLVDLSMRRGFAGSLPAAFGAASADLTYAAVAAVVGAAAAAALAPYAGALRTASVVVLLAIAAVRARGLLRPDRKPADARSPESRPERGGIPTYLAFLGLTLLNPLTVAYFAALIVGLGRTSGSLADALSKALFVIGAFVASAAWQVTLVATGALLHHRLPENARTITGLVGTAVIVALALRLAVS
jgi:arginine exporter protein ArgO